MADTWFSLSRVDQQEALQVAAASLGRPAHLLEKDIWVVWALEALFASDLAQVLTFKGGTSLSKAYGLIQRFSEDIDLTCDIRHLVPEAVARWGEIPSNRSQEKKLSAAVRDALPGWIQQHVVTRLQAAAHAMGAPVTLSTVDAAPDKLLLHYPAVSQGTGYAAPTVLLEFGARATGEPNAPRRVACDMALANLPDLHWPEATPRVMLAERTFWEKATAAHVYCLQHRLRGERYARHWYDLWALNASEHAAQALADRALAQHVAAHKTMFFAEKAVDGSQVDYAAAVSGRLQLVPEGASRQALSDDYDAMLADGLVDGVPPTFAQVLDACRLIEAAANRAPG